MRVGLALATTKLSKMGDVVDSVTRSQMMAGIKGKHTKPERKVRVYLHRNGFRYSLHRRDLPGTPDLVLRKYHAVVFVHGCFWHMHKGCKFATFPSTRPEFWRQKLEANGARDERQCRDLRRMGWRVAVVWECSLKLRPEAALAELSDFLRSDQGYAEFAADQVPKIE